MEWKEHVAWIAPIAMTMVAYVVAKYGPSLAKYRGLRNAALIFTLAPSWPPVWRVLSGPSSTNMRRYTAGKRSA
jgi:hypothetical protein